ncbi:MAG: MATE family efflux transporter [Fusobacteria bacterium]|nr:MATE family efflux transporter [Fusobacteriota bacterium]
MEDFYNKKNYVFEQMRSGKIGKVMIKFAIPSVLSLLVGDFYNISNTHYLNYYTGHTGVATLAITGNFFMLLIALSYLFSTGTQILLSIYLGRSEMKNVKNLISISVVFTFVLGIVLGAVLYKIIPTLLYLFAAPQALFSMTQSYIAVTLIGLPFILVYFLFFGIFSSFGKFNLTLCMSIIFCIGNLFFVPIVLINGYGMAGVAWVNVIASICVDIILFSVLVFSKKFTFCFLKDMQFALIEFFKVMYIGLAYFLPFFTKIIAMTLVLQWMKSYNSVWLLASWGAYFRFYMFAYMVMVGMRQAAMPIFAYFKGYDREKAMVAYETIVKWVGNVAMITWIMVLIFIDPIMKFQLDNIYGKHILLIMCLALPFAGIETLSLGYLQTQLSIKLTILLDLLDKVVLILVTVILVQLFGQNGFYYIFIVTSIIMCIVIYKIVTHKRVKRYN